MNTTKRIKKIQARLRRKKIDAILISQPHNRRYLSGYTATDHDIGESSGSLLIPARKNPLLLTDFRFQIQAEREAKEMKVLLYPKGLQALLKELLPDLGISSLAFESHYTLHNVAEKLQTMCSKLSISLHPTHGIVEKMRTIKNKKEIEKIRSSVLLNEQVFQTVYKTIFPGQTEIDIALALESTMRRRSAEAPSFESIVATGERSALPHAVPGPVKIEKHRPLMIDMGLILDGYCSDITRTFCLGQPADDRFLAVWQTVLQAQQAAIHGARAGLTGQAVDKLARDVIDAAGYGDNFGHGLGHSLGLVVHESPRYSYTYPDEVPTGVVMTVEPGIYLPGWGGVRIEDVVLVQADGVAVLTGAPVVPVYEI